MKKTETSSFGTGKRESHDSSAFYGRNLFDTKDSGASDSSGIFGRGLYNRIFIETATKADQDTQAPAPDDWADRIYCRSSEDMSVVPDNSVALVFTSPPYNVGKEYDNDMDLKEYLELIRRVAGEVYRVLRPGGRYVINIANLGRKPYIPLHAYFYDIHLDMDFRPMGEIIWRKAKGAGGNCAWGSWKSAKSPRIRDIHEYLLVFAKGLYSRPDIGMSDIEDSEFLDATLSIWEIPPESAKLVGHPAPFPSGLAARVIKLYSYVGDVVLDPFVGSGATCIAAVQTKRHYVGFDISEKYCEIAEAGLAEELAGGRMTAMARAKTECSELSVGFGILGVSDPLTLTKEDIARFFEDTVPPSKYARFCKEFVNATDQKLYQQLYDTGHAIRTTYPLFGLVSSLQWAAPNQQGSTTSASIDLRVANTPVSVKAGSNVVLNASPYNLFVGVPSGGAVADKSENWYQFSAPDTYQALYAYVRNPGLEHLPEKVADFEHSAKSSARLAVENGIKEFSPDQRDQFQKLYLEMCHQVAQRSAEIFNENIANSTQGRTRADVLEKVAKYFFRMDSMEYLLCGVESGKPFAVVIPDVTKWRSEWRITKVEAVSDLERKQSVVRINIQYEHKPSKLSQMASFHIEVRWSHGKFRQTPEAKLYKDFAWKEIKFFKSILP